MGRIPGSITGVKLSVSLPEGDVAFIDAYVNERQAPSRSAVVHEALEMLRLAQLSDDYAAAFEEWEDSGEEALWDTTTGDGLDDPRTR
jgi:Arc/MetJ-type ribon-helix-helix transcriptional regulator